MTERFRWTHSSANQRPSLSSFSADSFSINQGQSVCVTGLRKSECTCRVATKVLKKELQMSLSSPVLSDSSSCFVIPVALLQVSVCERVCVIPGSLVLDAAAAAASLGCGTTAGRTTLLSSLCSHPTPCPVSGVSARRSHYTPG